MINKICVAGAGTMGSGIALCAAQYGFETILFDTNELVLNNAQSSVNKNLDVLLEKNKITTSEKALILQRLKYTNQINDCIAPLIIEAIVEKPEIKIALFNQLAAVNEPSTIFASNTSSLSINLLQDGIINPERVAGMHFFNPAQIMKLVEVVKAKQTADTAIEIIMYVCRQMQKTPVLCIDAPGFIVNRVARHYYLEAMRLVENNQSTIEQVDEIMEASGFKMGPFALMDYIGHDVNYVVTETVFESFYYDPRYKPSFSQKRLLEAGWLGRKTGRGFYNYAASATLPKPTEDLELGKQIVDRVVAMLINEAMEALHLQIANAADLETAMTKGVNYPKGLLAWCEEWGKENVLAVLDNLYHQYHEDRYRACVLLRK